MAVLQQALLCPATTFSNWTAIATVVQNANGDLSDDTIVAKFVGLTSVATKFRVTCGNTFTAPTSGSQMTAMYFGEGASSGDAMDFASSPAPVQVLFGGSGTVSFSALGTFLSDEISFAATGINPIMIAFQFNASATKVDRRGNLSPWLSYRDQGAADASTTNKTGGNYSTYGTNQIPFITKIEAN